MALEIRILGRVDALVDGEPLSVGGSKQRGVLAMLALRANRTVSADALIDGLWGDRPPASAAKNVQLYVSRLRKALGEDGSEASIVTRGRGYELQLPEEAVDAARFERLVERARREAEQGIVDGAAQGALELWRGAPLADVAEEPFAGPEIRRLEELHLRAIELAIDAELAAGRHSEVIGSLEAMLAEQPLRERFHAQRMLALYRAGRQAEALEAYREATRTLIDQIGVEPGPELRRLEDGILRQDPALDPPAPREDLPAQLEGGSPVLAGRERELRWLRKRWEEADAGRPRVALVAGPGGIGKTRLAAELAAELQRTGAGILYATGTGTPQTALETIAAASESERPTLLVLDEADDASPTLLEAAADLAERPRESTLLILALHQDEQGPPALARLEVAGTAQRLALRPLGPDAIAGIAELYASGDGLAVPLDTLMAESEGVPLQVHRAASAWAQAQAAERLEATVGQAAGDRSGLQTAEAELAGSVADLQAARERTSLYVVEEPVDPSAPLVCPFRGLATFDSAHAEYFFGRERLVAGLMARLVGSTLLAVVGPSGSGKSSVVRAGLLPALASGVLPGSERWRQVLMRPGEHPLEELGRALARLAPGDSELEGDDPFAAVLGSLGPDERLVLTVDQFEEMFTACRDASERAAFAEALVGAADDPDQRIVAVLAIRADFYGRCAEYQRLSAKMSANHVLVGPMRREELRRAIALPARRAALRVEPRLVSVLVGEVADEPGGLPLLSTTLLELWEQRSGRTLRHSTYEARGGVSGAVARLAEGAYQRLSKPQRAKARLILLRLVDAEEPEPVRRRVPLPELELERDNDAAGALAVLTESRLVTVDEGTVEVAHEALLREWPRLRAWLEEDAEGRRLHQHLIHAAGEWQGSGREPAELYRGARLASALDWAATHHPELNQLERDFLEESQAASEREAERQRRTNRRLRALLAGVGVLLAAAVVAGAIARSERQGAREAATVADAERLGAEALTEDRLADALLLANAGVALDDSVKTRSNLLSTLLRSPAALGVLNVGGEPSSTALSPDGRTLAVAERDGSVLLFDTETRELLGDHDAPGPVWSLAFDPAGGSLAVAGGVGSELHEGYLAILDAGTAQVRSSASLGRHPAAPGPGLQYFETAAYAPDGRSLVVTYSGGDVNRSLPLFMRRYDAGSAAPLGRAVRVAGRSVSVNPLMSPDGRLLASSDRATYAIDARTLSLVRRYPVGVVDSSAISPDGGTLAIEDTDGGLRLLDLGSGRMRTLAAPRDPDSGQEIGSFSPDGRTLATWGENETVVLWDVGRGAEIETLAGHAGEGSSQVFSPDGRTLYTAAGDSTVIIWDVAGDRRLGSPFRTGLRTIPEEAFPPAFALSPDGETLAVARLDGKVDLIDAETLRRRATFEAFEDTPATAIDYAPDGRHLAVGGARGLIGMFDARSGRRIGPLLDAPRDEQCADPRSTFRIPRCHDATIQGALAFGPGNLLAAASIGGELRIWDLDDREPIRSPLHLPPFVIGLAFSPDGSQLAIPFGYNNPDPNPDGVEVLDTRSGERIITLPTEAEVRSVAFSPDGSLLASGQVDGTALVWATDDWRQVGAPLAVDRGFVLGLAFSPDARTLAASNFDGTVALWDVDSQQPIEALPGPVDRWVTAGFTPDGSHMFAVYENGQAIRWEVGPAAWRSRACAVTGGGLTPEQWEEIVPEQEYIEVCPSD